MVATGTHRVWGKLSMKSQLHKPERVSSNIRTELAWGTGEITCRVWRLRKEENVREKKGQRQEEKKEGQTGKGRREN